MERDEAVLKMLRAIPPPAHTGTVWFLDLYRAWTLEHCVTAQGRERVLQVHDTLLRLVDPKFHQDRVSMGFEAWHLQNLHTVSRLLSTLGAKRKDMRKYGDIVVGMLELFSSNVYTTQDVLLRALN